MPQSAFADLIPGQPAAQPGLVPLTAPKPEVRQVGSQLGVVNPASGQFTPTYTAPEKPDKAQFVPKGATQMMTPEGRVVPIPGVDGDPAKDMRVVLDDLKNVVRAAQRAKGRSKGWFMTGVGADWIGGNTPAGRSLRGDLSIIGANTAFDRLQKMRDESPTGGALGQVSNIELDLLRQSVAALDPGMSDVDFQNNMDTIIERYKGMYERLGGDPSALSESDENRRGGEGAGDIGFNTPDQPTNPFTPEQQRAYDAFLAGNPQATAAQLIAFTNKLGAGDLDPQRAQEIIDVYRKTGEFAPGAEAVSGLTPEQKAEIERKRAEVGENLAAAYGWADTASVGAAPKIAAGVDAFIESMRGKGSFTDNYADNLAVNRGLQDAVSEDYPVPYTLGQIAGGFALPIGGATSAARLAGIGAAYSGAYGFNSDDSSSVVDKLVATGVGAGVGAAAAGSFGLIGNHLAARGAGRVDPRRADARSLIEAAGRQNIDVLPADVGGGRIGDLVRRATGGLGQGFVAGPRIQEAAEATTRGFQARVGELAAEEGAAQGRGAVGATVLDALEGFNARTQLEGSDIYANARRMAAGQEFQGQKAVETLDQHIAELAQNENTNKPLIDGLNRLRSDLASGADLKTKGVDAMRNLRTSVRAEAGTEGLRGTDYKRRANEVLDSLSEDIASQLPKEAADEFQKGDALWRDRLNFIDDVEERLLGPKGDRSAEKVMRSLIEMSRSDTRRFRLLLNQVTPEEAGIIRSSFIQDMGRAAPGNPESFSIEAWAKNFRTLRDQSGGSLDLLFRGASREHANDLLTIAQGVERAGNARNFSNTGSAINATTVLQMLGLGAGGGVGGFVGAAAGLGTAAAIEAALGKALTSPNFARWLARPPKERGRALKRLSRIAAREPAIAAEIVPIQNALQRAIPQAAAEQDEQQ